MKQKTQIFTKPEAKEEIERLVQKFDSLSKSALRKYNEANTRKDFILPLFFALGGDVRNTFTDNEVVEEETTVSGRIDYSFRLNNITQFLLEAKAIPEDLDKDKWARQAIEYGWNKGIPWVVLTDFEGLKVFNSEWKVDKTRPNLEFSYKDYLEKFDRLWLLSKESFENNELDKLLSEFGVTAKRVSVNEKLAEDLVSWRNLLTRNLKLWNKNLDVSELEEAVQRILDRLIFIRVVEDRSIEDKVLWQAFQKWKSNSFQPNNFIESLVPIFRRFDKEYNSNLFQTHLCEKLDTEGEPFKKIIPELYASKEKGVKYRFDAIDADVLGNVYEQYLGHVQQREGETSKRKKQGIYYTPTYIVDYIVQNTVGKLLKETPSLAKKENIKILDPACGSGSFLIKAFEVMDEHLREARNSKANDHGRAALRKYRILTSNIYGVDLDEQAVEISRLNLLLKALVPNQKLPLLTEHMKTGNSLISGTPEKLKEYFGSNYQDKKPFNWEDEFPEVFKRDNPGFDIIIGNPPYVGVRKLKSEDKNYFEKNYEVAKEQYDLYTLFIERALNLLKHSGHLGFIIPNKFLITKYGLSLRKFICENATLVAFKNYSHDRVFPDASVYPVVLILKKGRTENIQPSESYDLLKTFALSETDEIVEKVERIKRIKLKVWRPLATANDITKGKNIIITNREISRYSFRLNRKGKLNKSRDRDKTKNKIILKKLCYNLEASLDEKGFHPINTTYCLRAETQNTDLRYVLGILNSKLLTYFARKKYSETALRGGFIELRVFQVRELPILEADPKDQKIIADLVGKILRLSNELKKLAENTDKWRKLKDEIEKLDRKIDEEIYKLYNLTPEEIEIVEG